MMWMLRRLTELVSASLPAMKNQERNSRRDPEGEAHIVRGYRSPFAAIIPSSDIRQF